MTPVALVKLGRDVRLIDGYQESRINHKAIINIPAEAVKPGYGLSTISKAWFRCYQKQWIRCSQRL